MITTEETVFLMARELEWAEAFVEDHPSCELGMIYFKLLERELAAAEEAHEQLLRSL
jgi:hypothetical protein